MAAELYHASRIAVEDAAQRHGRVETQAQHWTRILRQHRHAQLRGLAQRLLRRAVAVAEFVSARHGHVGGGVAAAAASGVDVTTGRVVAEDEIAELAAASTRRASLCSGMTGRW